MYAKENLFLYVSFALYGLVDTIVWRIPGLAAPHFGYCRLVGLPQHTVTTAGQTIQTLHAPLPTTYVLEGEGQGFMFIVGGSTVYVGMYTCMCMSARLFRWRRCLSCSWRLAVNHSILVACAENHTWW